MSSPTISQPRRMETEGSWIRNSPENSNECDTVQEHSELKMKRSEQDRETMGVEKEEEVNTQKTKTEDRGRSWRIL